jgi:DNA-binding MarR family transcriptional regulator
MVLLKLWEKDGVTQKELAQQLCVEAPTVTRMLQRMERCDLIERRADANDGRVSRVYVTERSCTLQPTVKEGWAELEEGLLVGMTEEEQTLLHRLLAKMLDNLSN